MKPVVGSALVYLLYHPLAGSGVHNFTPSCYPTCKRGDLGLGLLIKKGGMIIIPSS